jgi:hypothetical protein
MPDAPSTAASTPSGITRRVATALTLFAVSAAMVYGTWLAVDDMRAKPMVAQVTIAGDALCVANDSGFTWLTPSVTINGTFVASSVPLDLATGATACLPLDTFVDDQGRDLASTGEPVREVTATASRRSRFGTFNAERRISGRWPFK